MVNAVSSSLVSGLGFVGSTSSGAGSSSAGSTFGPDFLLSALGLGSSAYGASYDASGNAIAPTSGAAGKARTAALALARQSLRAGDYATARDAARSVLEQDSSDVAALYYVGRSYLEQGDFTRAQSYLSRAASLSGDHRIEADLKAARLLPRGSDAVVAEIQRLLRQPNTQSDGARLATQLLQQEPDNLDARLALVDFYQSNGKVNLAGAELVDAINNTPKDGLGKLIARLEQFAGAHPYDPGSHDLLGQAYAKAGKLDEAQRAFTAAIRLAGDNTRLQIDIRKDQADVLSRVGHEAQTRGDTAAARSAYQQAIALVRDDARRSDLSTLEYDEGTRSLAAGNLRGALASLENARVNLPIDDTAKLTDKVIAAYETLATKFAAVGDLKRVASARNGAFLLDSSDDTRRRSLADANDAYGLSLLGSGDYYGAIKAFRAATKLYSDDTNYAAHLADAFSHI